MSIGIDIGHFKSKLIMLSKSGKDVEVQKINNCNSFNDLKIFDPDTVTKAQWVASIQELCKDVKINPKNQKNLVSSLIGSSTTIKQILTVEMAGEELTQALEFEAKKHIPLDGTEPILDYHIIGQNKEELDKNDILLVATTKNYINKHNDLLKKSGFKPKTFDADPLALMNCFLYSNDLLIDH